MAHISEQLGCPVYMENDAVAMGYGEAFFGDTKGDFDYIIGGTGIGGSLIRHEDSGVRVVEKDWPVHFKNWEMQDGGRRLAIEYGKPTTDFTEEDWGKVATRFKRNVALYCQKYNPKAIVFGGGLATRHAEMLIAIGKDIKTPIVVTQFGDDSGLVGGFGLIKNGLQ